MNSLRLRTVGQPKSGRAGTPCVSCSAPVRHPHSAARLPVARLCVLLVNLHWQHTEQYTQLYYSLSRSRSLSLYLSLSRARARYLSFFYSLAVETSHAFVQLLSDRAAPKGGALRCELRWGEESDEAVSLAMVQLQEEVISKQGEVVAKVCGCSQGLMSFASAGALLALRVTQWRCARCSS